MFRHDWSGIPDKPPRCKSCASLGHFAQDCPNSKGDNPKIKGKSKGKGDGKGKDNSAGANTPGGNSVTNKAIVIEEVSQSQSASPSSGTPQPTIVVQTATPPTTTPDLKTLIADLSSALKSEAKIHMKALEVEIAEKVKEVILTDTHFGSQSPEIWLIVGLLMHLGKGLRRRCVQPSMYQSRWLVMRSPHFASHSWAQFSCLIPHNPLCQWVL